jgi:hypothetical protein
MSPPPPARDPTGKSPQRRRQHEGRFAWIEDTRFLSVHVFFLLCFKDSDSIGEVSRRAGLEGASAACLGREPVAGQRGRGAGDAEGREGTKRTRTREGRGGAARESAAAGQSANAGAESPVVPGESRPPPLVGSPEPSAARTSPGASGPGAGGGTEAGSGAGGASERQPGSRRPAAPRASLGNAGSWGADAGCPAGPQETLKVARK